MPSSITPSGGCPPDPQLAPINATAISTDLPVFRFLPESVSNPPLPQIWPPSSIDSTEDMEVDLEIEGSSGIRIPDRLASLLEDCESLPRPPGLTFRILQRTRDPGSSTHDIAKILAADPVLAAKVIRTANSPVYAQQQPVRSLDRAVTVLGFEATGSTAVSFSLLKSIGATQTEYEIDFKLFWRRSLLSAIAGKLLATSAGDTDPEEVFLACLLQDIGLLALAQAAPSLYSGMAATQLHQDLLVAREQSRFSADHSEVGAWMMQTWEFPDEIRQGILASHNPRRLSNGAFGGCVAVSSSIAEVFLDCDGRRRFQALANIAKEHLDLQPESLLEVLEKVASRIPESERIYEMTILGDIDPSSVIKEAAESLGLAVPCSEGDLARQEIIPS